VTDQNAADVEAGASDAEEEAEEFELEGHMDRAEGANVLRRLADGVESGSVELGRDEGPVTLPDEFETEVEYEEGGDEAELEVEFEWSLDDGETDDQ